MKSAIRAAGVVLTAALFIFIAAGAPPAAAGTTPPPTQGAATTQTCDNASGSGPCLTQDSAVFKPLGDTSIQGVIGNVIKYITGLVGVLALAMFIYGGLMWMLAAGNQEKVTKAKNTIVWAISGLVMVFAAYALVSFVIQAVGG